MKNRPSTFLNWTNGSFPNVQEPPASFRAAGWQPDQAPPAEYANWTEWLTDQWIKYFDSVVSGGTPDNVIRLINGGYWSFNKTTNLMAWSLAANIAIPGVPDTTNTIPAGSVTMNDGDVAFTSISAPTQQAGDVLSGSQVVSNMAFTSDLAIGMSIVGAGIPSGTTVIAVGVSTIMMSAAATATMAQELLTFSVPSTLTVTSGPSASSFIPNSNTILIARRSGDVIYLGVNTGQMLLRDGESKPLLGSGYFTVYPAIAGQNLTAGQVVYISAGSTDGGRTAKAVYPLDCSAMYAPTRSQFAGVVISDTATGVQAQILYSGFYQRSVITGVVYYADPANPGGITDIFPTATNVPAVPVGFATTDGTLLVDGASTSQIAQPAFLFFKSERIGIGDGTRTAFTTTLDALSATATFVHLNGVNQDNSTWYLTGGNTINFNTPPAPGQPAYAQYVLANQIYLNANQEVPQGVINGTNRVFTLAGTPISQASMFLWRNGLDVELSEWSISVVLGVATITFVTAPPTGSKLNCAYFLPVGTGGGGGSVNGAANLGTGVGVFSAEMGGILAFKSITNATDNGDGTITITGSSSDALEIHGSVSSPSTFNPTAGLTVTTAMKQLWFLQTSGGDQNVTATTQISAGSTIGQEISLVGVDSANCFVFAGTPGTYVGGVNGNGSVRLDNNQYWTVFWDGTGWYEKFRRA